jgi:hypothetical protein
MPSNRNTPFILARPYMFFQKINPSLSFPFPPAKKIDIPILCCQSP